ncbi:MAG: PD40 domain-containing protein [Fibrobacteraceae bacterium]|nr:PD40 domain-containing protein [Fibrobacteraceae bacterium]
MYNYFKKFAFGVVASIFVSNVFAAGFYGNQSDVQWKKADTEHFQFIYPAEYTDHASKVSSYAEAVYDSVVSRYKPLPGRVNAVITNALYSNGSAIPSENGINLFLSNWDFKVRSSHSWLTDVVTHEFSHLVSIESGSKLPPSLYGLQASYIDYYNERTTSDFMTMVPFTMQPLWLAEGTTQYESSRMGFDSWDSHRDMLLRTAALNDSLLTLEYMHDFSDNSLLAELGPYNQGFALVRYITQKYGDEALPKIWRELSKPYRVTLDGAIQKVLGISEKKLYEEWKKEITEHYKAQKESLGNLVEGSKLTTDAFYQDFPVVAGKYVYGISNFGGPWFDGKVFKMPITLDSIKDEKSKEDSLVILDFEGTIDIADYAKSGFTTKKPWFDKGIDVFEDSTRGPFLAYVSYQNRDKNGHAHFDIAISDTNKNQISATYLADAVYPTFDKQGTSIVFVRRENASTRFVLSKVKMPEASLKDYVAEEPVDIFVPEKNYLYYNIYSPKFSPDGKRIAFGFFDDVQRGIAVINSDGSNFKVITDNKAATNLDERDVNWIDNERIIYASNQNGIFNLFQKNLTTGVTYPLTNVVGGAFTPVMAHDTLFFTAYDKDGFSLYKMPYVDYEKGIGVKDSTIKITDTTYTVCPEPQPSTQPTDALTTDTLAANSLATDSLTTDSLATDSLTKDSILCKPQMQIVSRDSLIQIKIVNIEPIQLKGVLPEPIHKNLEYNDIEFAGIEKNYKPIPTVPLFVPILSFNENAPDLTVFGDGKVKTKAGLAVLLSDPLKKNSLQMGFVLEIGNGFDYINSEGLNPKQEKEFFVSWLNKSTPIDLGFTYTYANYTSKDTVRYEDVAAHDGDSLGMSHYAIPMQAIIGTAGYSIFKSIDTLQVALGYDWAEFNLYEDQFSWEYQKKISALVALGLYGDNPSEEASNISGQGNGALLYYQYINSDLYRPGTFAESFYITESGSIKPKYRNFKINQVGINLYGSLQSPFTGARLAGGAKLSGILNWDTDAKEDTLDSYYYSPIFLEGYPYLRSSESYTRSGTKTFVAEAHYLFPIYDDWRHNFWIFGTRSFYIDLFAQMGAAWDTKWFDKDKLTNHNFWDRDVGLSFRMSNKIFYNVPLDISLTFARALSRIGEDDNLNGGYKLDPIDLPVIPKDMAPTRIKFAISMGFINSWQ